MGVGDSSGGRWRGREVDWLVEITQPDVEGAGLQTWGTKFLGQFSNSAFSQGRLFLINWKVCFVTTNGSQTYLYPKASLCQLKGSSNAP